MNKPTAKVPDDTKYYDYEEICDYIESVEPELSSTRGTLWDYFCERCEVHSSGSHVHLSSIDGKWSNEVTDICNAIIKHFPPSEHPELYCIFGDGKYIDINMWQYGW